MDDPLETARRGLMDILLVEDSEDDQVLTERALDRCGIARSITVAHDGAEALDYLFGLGMYAARDTSALPDVILLDLKLPKLDGLKVLECVRSDTRTRGIPVVILTSSDEENDLVESYKLGADSYVRKTVDFNGFCRTIAQIAPQWLELSARKNAAGEKGNAET